MIHRFKVREAATQSADEDIHEKVVVVVVIIARA
jgi:hypothetical protein